MSISAQIATVEKLVARSASDLHELTRQTAQREQTGSDTLALRSRLTDVEATLAYLKDVLGALEAAAPQSALDPR